MKVGLYFGTFNPIHIGHIILANHMLEFTDLDEIWMVVTPQSPFKQKKTLLDNHHRFEMVYRATKDFEHIHPSDIEFKLSQPNYTIDTLVHISEKYPYHDFSLLMGEDNLNTFHKWKNYEVILESHQLYVYPRLTKIKENNRFKEHPKVNMVEAPIIEISSTFIRKSIADHKNIRTMLDDEVWNYIDQMNFFK